MEYEKNNRRMGRLALTPATEAIVLLSEANFSVNSP
jgi:hypothetical protein